MEQDPGLVGTGTGRLSALGHAGRAGAAGRSRGRNWGVGFKGQGAREWKLVCSGSKRVTGIQNWLRGPGYIEE